MRRVRYSVAMSLDGYIAGPQGDADWIVMDPEIDFAEIFSQFDTMLLGRRTYEVTRQQSGPDVAMPGMKVIVFSTTLLQSDHPGVTIVADKAADVVRELKAQPGKDIWLFGGASLFGSLLDLDLVDTIEVAVIPVVLGAGVSLIPSTARRTKLKLVNNRIYKKTGIVSLEYSVTRGQ